MQLLSDWHLWVIAGFVLLIFEIFTPGFVIGIFGLACFASALIAGLGLGLTWQLIGFVIATAVFFFGVRPFFVSHISDREPKAKTNVDALIGQTAQVIEMLDSQAGTGRVKVGGEEWRAKTANEMTVEAGRKVVVRRVEGVTLFVEPI